MEIYTDNIHKMAYATDASAYREIPMAVAYPKTEEDLRELLRVARERHTFLIPRAGGTSIAGQVVGKGIVVDVSRYMNRILSIDPERRIARVQPGVVRDELNMALKPYGLFFSPETSTSNRCCIGGMVGNNSCGTHSLIYGSTRQHVVGLRLMLVDGSIVESESGKWKVIGESDLWNKIIEQLKGWQRDDKVRKLIEDNFPDKSLKRRSCGYALDECLMGNEALNRLRLNDELNIPALIAGSEGTLSMVTEIEVSLDPLPSENKVLVAAHLHNLNDSWQANLMALHHAPTAVELMDGKILELCKGNKQAEEDRFFVKGEPGAIVIAEFTGEKIEEQAAKFEKEVADIAYACTRVYNKDINRVWNLRKAGLGVLSAMPGDAKPVGVVEDTAVAPERLEAYMLDFQQMMSELGLDCVYYGHISTGELHLRPILNLKLEKDRVLFRQVAESTARLVKKHRGSLSGEHGDGRLRGEFIPLMYGEEVYELMCELKRTWDPEGLLNMGKIVDTPPMDTSLRWKVESLKLKVSEEETLLQRVERCNGAGDCRKSQLIGGALCPAYKVSHDELMTTRARANVIREVMTTSRHPWTNKDVKRQLDSCLACKSCIRECSSSVDMTRIRSELLQGRYHRLGVPFRTWLIAHMPMIEAVGAKIPRVYNWFATNKVTSAMIKAVVGFDQRRRIPLIAPIAPIAPIATIAPIEKQKVYLFVDEFTRYEEPQLAHDFVAVLEALGYEVVIPDVVQSGRPAISKGCLDYARKQAIKNVRLLADMVSEESPLVGIDPSCILSFRDEYPRLVPKEMHEKAKELGNNALLYDEFLMREIENGHIDKARFGAIKADIWLHGHCHQKALVGIEKTADLLRLIPQSTLHVIPSGCCGMAGSFGYEKKHYETSMAIGELVLFPTLRKVKSESESGKKIIVAAPGTSCRQQIYDGTGIQAVHPIEILKQSIIL